MLLVALVLPQGLVYFTLYQPVKVKIGAQKVINIVLEVRTVQNLYVVKQP